MSMNLITVNNSTHNYILYHLCTPLEDKLIKQTLFKMTISMIDKRRYG